MVIVVLIIIIHLQDPTDMLHPWWLCQDIILLHAEDIMGKVMAMVEVEDGKFSKDLLFESRSNCYGFFVIKTFIFATK
jgi:hypothetical protein